MKPLGEVNHRTTILLNRCYLGNKQNACLLLQHLFIFKCERNASVPLFPPRRFTQQMVVIRESESQNRNIHITILSHTCQLLSFTFILFVFIFIFIISACQEVGCNDSCIMQVELPGT